MTCLIATLDGVVEQHNLLNHPFYQRWNAGEMTAEELRVYACEYFHFVRAVPTFVSAVHSNCKNHPLRLSILENLIEEETGGENLVPHEELWVWFGEGIGLTKADLYDACSAPETKKLLLTYRNLCHASFCAVGAAAMYAYESRIPQIAETKQLGLRKYYGIEAARTLRFFREHTVVDLEHARTWAEVILRLVETPEQAQQVVESADKASRALWGMLDGVCMQCNIKISS